MTEERPACQRYDEVLGSDGQPTLHRRGLLGAAAGGFALVASGLLLPAWPKEAEAREGAHRGALGGRHGKDRRGRDKRKRRDNNPGQQNNGGNDNDQEKGRAPGKGPFRDMQLNIHNRTSSPKAARVWHLYDNKSNISTYGLKWDDTLAPGETREYAGEELYLLATFDLHTPAGTAYFEGFNSPLYYPSMRFGSVPNGWIGDRTALLNPNRESYLDVGSSDTWAGVKVTRLEDSRTHIRFLLEI